MVHCYHGISRSAAVALGLLYLATGSEQKAIKQIMKQNSKVNPHKDILKYFDELVGSNFSDMDKAITAEAADEKTLAALCG
ncbi:MAG: hypothetical protein WCT14_00160 [Treponemataceae bacterium]